MSSRQPETEETTRYCVGWPVSFLHSSRSRAASSAGARAICFSLGLSAVVPAIRSPVSSHVVHASPLPQHSGGTAAGACLCGPVTSPTVVALAVSGPCSWASHAAEALLLARPRTRGVEAHPPRPRGGWRSVLAVHALAAWRCRWLVRAREYGVLY